MRIAELHSVLKQFQGDVNRNKRVARILKNWSPDIALMVEDEDAQFALRLENQQLIAVDILPPEARCEVVVQASCEVLTEVFSGRLSPMKANTDNMLKFFGSSKDEVKLDAICLTIWGI